MSGPDTPQSTVPFNIWATIISQYANSGALTQVLQSFQAAVDQTRNFDSFYNLIWNIDTAVGPGLDVWGRILGVPRVVTVVGPLKYFGFQESGTGNGFNQQAFWEGQVTANYPLPDNNYRTLLFAKALANISDGSVKSINQILLNLFPGRGNCYATDGLNMTMTYTFNFVLAPVEVAIVSGSGVLPKPAGVSATVIHL